MSKTDHKISWLRLEEGGRLQESRSLPANIHRVHWRTTSKRTRWPDYFRLRDEFRAAVEKIHADIIHAGPVQRVALLPAMVSIRPLISMSWGFDLLEDAQRDFIWRTITRYVLKKSDWFLADCQTVRQKALTLGMPADKTTVFPWGVDLGLFNARNRSDERLHFGYEQDLIFVHTRSWEPRYGVDIMLQGFWMASQTVSDIRLVLLGGGSQERWVKDFIRQKGLQERVHFCGYHENEDLAAYYRAADVYLSASHIDGSSVALMESMACGCPALVSDIPSNLEWVDHEVQGWVFKDGNPQDLAEKIIYIARSKELLAQAGRNARAKAEQNASWDENFNKLLTVYKHVFTTENQNNR